jgi:hypothetical protein
VKAYKKPVGAAPRGRPAAEGSKRFTAPLSEATKERLKAGQLSYLPDYKV